MIMQTCTLENGVDLYQNHGKKLVLCLVRSSSILCLKEDDKWPAFMTSPGWDLCISFQRRSWTLWEVNQPNVKYAMVRKLKTIAELSF